MQECTYSQYNNQPKGEISVVTLTPSMHPPEKNNQELQGPLPHCQGLVAELALLARPLLGTHARMHQQDGQEGMAGQWSSA